MSFKAKELNNAGLQNSIAMRLVCLQIDAEVDAFEGELEGELGALLKNFVIRQCLAL